jgi:hypothetical protein
MTLYCGVVNINPTTRGKHSPAIDKIVFDKIFGYQLTTLFLH